VWRHFSVRGLPCDFSRRLPPERKRIYAKL